MFAFHFEYVEDVSMFGGNIIIMIFSKCRHFGVPQVSMFGEILL